MALTRLRLHTLHHILLWLAAAVAELAAAVAERVGFYQER
jgi:hypothetical protein